MDSSTNQIIITGILSLLSALLASYITSVANKNSDNRKLLAEYIAEVLSLYAEFALKGDNESTVKLLSAIEKAKLFANNETEIYLSKFHDEIMKRPIDSKKCGELMVYIHFSAKKQLKN